MVSWLGTRVFGAILESRTTHIEYVYRFIQFTDSSFRSFWKTLALIFYRFFSMQLTKIVFSSSFLLLPSLKVFKNGDFIIQLCWWSKHFAGLFAASSKGILAFLRKKCIIDLAHFFFIEFPSVNQFWINTYKQSLSNKVQRWDLFMKYNLKFGKVWDGWQVRVNELRNFLSPFFELFRVESCLD